MSTEIKYKNWFGDQLTIQQVQLLNDDYQQEQYIDGALKKIDYYSNNQISYGDYYLSQGEELQAVLSELQDVWGSGTFYIDTQTIGNYTVRDWEDYQGLVKLFKGQTVYDSQGREIAQQTVDINTLTVIKTTKNYYLETFGRFKNNGDIQNYGVIEFAYDNPFIPAEGIRVKINLGGYEHRAYYITDQNNILLNPSIAEVFSWNDQTYYQSASPFIPS